MISKHYMHRQQCTIICVLYFVVDFNIFPRILQKNHVIYQVTSKAILWVGCYLHEIEIDAQNVHNVPLNELQYVQPILYCKTINRIIRFKIACSPAFIIFFKLQTTRNAYCVPYDTVP